MNADRVREQIEHRLAAEWLANTDDDGDPGKWYPGRYLDVGEVREVDLIVLPLWRAPDDAGWWNDPGPGRTEEGWVWEDEDDSSFGIEIVPGSHSERPPVPDAVVEYVMEEGT